MGITVLQEISLSKIMSINKFTKLYFLMLLLIACNDNASSMIISDSHNDLELNNGILFFGNETFNGTIISRYVNQSMKSEIQYLKGKKNGFERHWYKNHTLAIDRTYHNGLKVGIHYGFWENGKKKFIYHFNDQGAYEGSVKEWFRTGQLLRHFNYVNGRESGKQQMWLENGKLRANYEVIDDERYGLIGLKKCYQL